MPAATIIRTLQGKRKNIPIQVNVLDYPYKYTHETPFPVKEKRMQQQIEEAFFNTFGLAAGFLS
jgi:hypothetical protein